MTDNQLFTPGYSLLFMVVKVYLNTALERTLSYARHAVGNCDGGQGATTIESMESNARHAVGDRDGGQTPAILESLFAYARHAVFHPFVDDRGRYVHIAVVISAGVLCHFGPFNLDTSS